MTYGLIERPIEPDHFVHGDGKLGAGPLVIDGNWTPWLPSREIQNLATEPSACATFAVLNAVETMLLQEKNVIENFSDRFLAYVSGTTREGNDPHTVCETLRKEGDVREIDWPYTLQEDTWEKFYTKPTDSLYTKAKTFLQSLGIDYGHSWVLDTSPQGIMDALTFSPLTAAVDAWHLDANDLYYRTNDRSNHYVMIFNYKRNYYWEIFDSYDQNVKHLRWDYPFDRVKRHTLHRAKEQTDLLTQLITACKALVTLLQLQLKQIGLWNG